MPLPPPPLTVHLPGSLSATHTASGPVLPPSETFPDATLSQEGPALRSGRPATPSELPSGTPNPPAPTNEPRKPLRRWSQIAADLEARARVSGLDLHDPTRHAPNELVHCEAPPEPERPPVPVFDARTARFRLDVELPLNDDRCPSLDLLMDRIRAVLRGDLLTPGEKGKALFGARKLKRAAQTAVSEYSKPGRPTLVRHGIIVLPDGRNEDAFYSMSDLASKLDCPYSSVNQKYLNHCRSSNTDPNDHDGVTFVFKKHKITVQTR